MHKLKISLILSALVFLSACDPEDLGKVIDIRERIKKPCIIAVSPAINKKNTKFHLQGRGVIDFISQVRDRVGIYQYTYIESLYPIPKACQNWLSYTYSNDALYRQQCMVPWAKQALQKQTYNCKKTQTYIIGANIHDKKAKLLIVNHARPDQFAHKRQRYARGADLNRLASSMARKIIKEMR